MHFNRIILCLLVFIFQTYLYADSFYLPNNGIPFDLNPMMTRPVSYWDDGKVQRIYLPSDYFLVEAKAVNPSVSSKDIELVQRRRSFLDKHQLAGFTTWALWLATNLAGEQALRSYKREYEPLANIALLSNPSQNGLLYYGIMNASPWDSKSASTHKSLAAATFLMYSATAGLAFFSPGKLQPDREEGWTSIFTHKAMIFIHLPSMIGLAVLGGQVEKGGPHTVHQMQNVGWLGFSAITVAIATFYF